MCEGRRADSAPRQFQEVNWARELVTREPDLEVDSKARTVVVLSCWFDASGLWVIILSIFVKETNTFYGQPERQIGHLFFLEGWCELGSRAQSTVSGGKYLTSKFR